MKTGRLLGKFLMLVLACCSIMPLQAGSTPKFSILPINRPPAQLPINAIAIANYVVINNTSITRRLTMEPILGVTAVPGTGNCSIPFVLTPGASCILSLRLIANQMGAGVHGGPIICKTKSPTDNTPDPFLCSQPEQANELNVTVVPAAQAILTASPSFLKFTITSGGTVTITNSASTLISAENIRAIIPPNSPLILVANNCPAILAPGASCNMAFTSAVPTEAQVIFQGSNTTSTFVTILVSESLISVSPTSIAFSVNGTGSVTVTNVSDIVARNVTAVVPAGSSISVVGNTCGAALAPGASCSITFTGSAVETRSVLIGGSNTNRETITVRVAAMPIISIAQPRAVITVGGPAVGITVTNSASSTVNALNIHATLPGDLTDVVQDSGNCASVAPGASCTLFFSSPTPYVTHSNIPVSGSNTANSVPIALAFQYGGGLVYAISGGNAFVITNVDVASNVEWGNYGQIVGANSQTDGAFNTSQMIAAGNTGAGDVCFTYAGSGFTDWYLPAVDQWFTTIAELVSLGFGYPWQVSYWTSTEGGDFPLTNAYYTAVFDGSVESIPKTATTNIRCGRTQAITI
ncbi:DUF1566 domain-containing protein [Legionella jordanis]|uniref:Protein with a bacterial immunoglobulin-like domain protein n=1 Tax=Legionella jordanis TaxID=456 RepID=A0A0W0VC59_9GAMM|nr:DUF1566 domain-containing protein [Legionella jordanis]KTD17672.1 protein with a bacterial immunoglobulin-like domain protein [Legionella jordanis]VEH11399.1 protein with a bacterial immunoglobulin-like domain [Legionella jordanis]